MLFLIRYIGVHRGQFFAEQKTTTVRKLLPESWWVLQSVKDLLLCSMLCAGCLHSKMLTLLLMRFSDVDRGFMCPVHTPDGAPCGLLNHLASACEVLSHPCDVPRTLTVKVLVSLGLVPLQSGALLPGDYLPCLLDGVVIGKLPPALLTSYVGLGCLCQCVISLVV